MKLNFVFQAIIIKSFQEGGGGRNYSNDNNNKEKKKNSLNYLSKIKLT